MSLRAATLLALGIALSGSAFAHPHGDGDHHGFKGCDVNSRYDLTFDGNSLTFSSKDVSPARIEMRRGQLLVDGRVVALSDADRARVQAFENEVRALAPEVKQIALDALDIAYSALVHVATAFSSDKGRDERLARLERQRQDARRQLSQAIAAPIFDEKEFERIIETTVKNAIPEFVGDIVGIAIAAALSGDEKGAAEIERRAEQLEKEIERDVEARADELEKRADALCPRIRELDRIESTLDLRLAGGGRLDLVNTKH